MNPSQPVPKTSEHYVAHLRIEKIERTADPNVDKGQRQRTVDEVTQIVLKADDLDKLVNRLGAHIALIEEG